MSRKAAAVVAAVVSAALLLGGCSGAGNRGSTGGYVSADGSVATVDPADRVTLPELSGVDLDGKAISTKDFAGKPLVVNVWGSWCAPCRKEAPVLKEVAEERDDAQFVGLLVRDKPASASAFNEKVGITYPSIVDTGGKLTMRFSSSLPSLAIPTTWVIDSKGRVAARLVTDDLDASTLSGLIDYAEKSAP